MSPVENLVEYLQARRNGNGWIACCPPHNDRTPSLSISECADRRALIKCHAGCDLKAVLNALGLTERDLFRVSNDGKRAVSLGKRKKGRMNLAAESSERTVPL